LPLDVLHGVEVHAALAADCEDWHDVAVVQMGSGLCFVLEALQLARIERRCEGQHLERDAAIERDLFRFVDHAHPAAAELAEDAEVAERAGGERTVWEMT
jgi:hypothetical protein